MDCRFKDCTPLTRFNEGHPLLSFVLYKSRGDLFIITRGLRPVEGIKPSVQGKDAGFFLAATDAHATGEQSSMVEISERCFDLYRLQRSILDRSILKAIILDCIPRPNRLRVFHAIQRFAEEKKHTFTSNQSDITDANEDDFNAGYYAS